MKQTGIATWEWSGFHANCGLSILLEVDIESASGSGESMDSLLQAM